jgi:hypothetical protein
MPSNQKLRGPRKTMLSGLLFSDDRVPLHVQSLVLIEYPIYLQIFSVHDHLSDVMDQGGLLKKDPVLLGQVKACT